jgi:Zn finger protein HypA/HybF involved in hydrogenase expression
MELHEFLSLVTSSANTDVEKRRLELRKAKCVLWCQKSQLVAAVQKSCMECGNSHYREPSSAISASVSAFVQEKELVNNQLAKLM